MSITKARFVKVSLSALVVVGATGACSIIADTSHAQCSTDSDCLTNAVSQLERPTCQAGYCVVQQCNVPTSVPDGGAVVVANGAFYAQPANGGLPEQSTIQPMRNDDYTVHACARADPNCARTSCGWLTPPIPGQPAPGNLPITIYPIPVTLPFDGYVVAVPNVQTHPDYLITALFPQQQIDANLIAATQGNVFGTALLVGGTQASVQAAFYAASVTRDTSTGTTFIFLYETLLQNGVPSLNNYTNGISVDLITSDGHDVLQEYPNTRRVFLDGNGNTYPGISATNGGTGAYFLNVPTGEYQIVVSRGSQTIQGTVLSLAGVSVVTPMILPPSLPMDAGTD
jgi:hypothetical protein